MQGSGSEKDICHGISIVDGTSEEVVDFIEIPHFSLASFTTQFDVPVQWDPDMLDRYAIGPDDVDFLRREIGTQMVFDFARFGYFIEAVRRG